MRKIWIASAAVVAAFSFTHMAPAADMPLKAPPRPPACASNVITRANNQVYVDFATRHLDYRESDPAGVFPVLDSEKGWIPGVTGNASLMQDWLGFCHLYLSAQITYLSGNTHYFAAAGPVTSNTDPAQIWDEDFKLGKGFDVSSNAMLTPYVGGGSHLWGRTLAGPNGYHEDYRHAYVGGGVLFQVSPVQRLVLGLDGFVGSTFDARMNTSLTPGGFPIPVQTFTLGNAAIWRIGGTADYAFTQNWHGNVGVEFMHFHYGQSPVGIGGFLEPTSNTDNVTVRVGLGYAW